MVLLDLVLRVEPEAPVFVIDTGLLFDETYALLERVEQRYGITVQRVHPALTVDEQATAHGPELWSRDPDACCNLRKVEPLRRHLLQYDAWLTAIRRDQSETRVAVEPVSWDDAAQVVKVAPLVNWTDAEVWNYVREKEIPVNTLHFDGYPSIGCVHCTRRVAPGEHPRAGRWSGLDKMECGLHG